MQFKNIFINESEDTKKDTKPSAETSNIDPNAGSKIVKLDVIKSIKEIQAQLTSITFLDALSRIHTENKIKTDVEGFETTLSDLRKSIEEFITDNHFDSAERQADEVPEGGEVPEETSTKKDDVAKKEADAKKIKISGESSGTEDEKKKPLKETFGNLIRF